MSEAAIRQAYREILGRDADAAGLQHWLRSGLPLEQIRSHLGSSSEGRQQTVRNLYQQTLGRAADQGGLQHYYNLLANGGWDVDRVRNDMMQSQEFKQSDAVLLTDPAYAAFVRSANLQESELQGETNSRRDAMDRAMQVAAPRYNMQRQDAERRQDNDFESRGLFRAGERLKRINDDKARVTQEQQQWEHSQREQMTEFEREQARRVADIRRQTGEQKVSARQRLTQRATEVAYG
jgi:hypothetical protein